MTTVAQPSAAPLHKTRPSAERPVSFRTNLQRARSRNIRRHWLRDVVRVSVLLASDVAVIVILWGALGWLRAMGTGLGGIGGLVDAVFAPGRLGGWRFGMMLLLAALVAGAYGPGDRRRDSRRLFAATGLAAFLSLTEGAWLGEVSLRFLQFGATVAAVGMFLALGRQTVDWMVDLLSPWLSPVPAVVVRDGHPDPSGLGWFKSNGGRPRGRLKIVASVSADGEPAGGASLLHRLEDAIEEHQADTVLVAAPLSDEALAMVLDAATVSGCRLLTSTSRLEQIVGTAPRAIRQDGRLLVELTAPSLTGWQLAAKRVLDLFGATVGLILLSPVFLVLAVLIRLDSPGPVFFRQRRVGRAGKEFRIYKLRSMVADAEARLDGLRQGSMYADQRLFKLKQDPRVTALGGWLRRSSLDELPQLLNVLRGEMSLVGPRPPLPSEVLTYEARHYCRFDVKPGITGPWQVSGRNRITDFETVVRLERDYIRDWSVFLDVKILLRTIPAVFRMDGAV